MAECFDKIRINPGNFGEALSNFFLTEDPTAVQSVCFGVPSRMIDTNRTMIISCHEQSLQAAEFALVVLSRCSRVVSLDPCGLSWQYLIREVIWLSFAVDARAQFKVKEWTDAEYQAELEHIEKVSYLFFLS